MMSLGELQISFPLFVVSKIHLMTSYQLACVAGGIRGHERMGSLKYRLPKNDTF
jgi:hypothetical protein